MLFVLVSSCYQPLVLEVRPDYMTLLLPSCLIWFKVVTHVKYLCIGDK